MISGFLEKLEREEIIPVVPAIEGVDRGGYFDLIKQRFANPEIEDTIPRLCQDGSNRQPKFILPSVRDRATKGQRVDGLALVSALWCRYCYGETEDGGKIDVDDIQADRLEKAAREARSDPLAFLTLEDIFGDLAENSLFRNTFEATLASLWRDGVTKTMAGYVNGSGTP